VAVVRPALGLVGAERHLGGLAAFVAKHDEETVAEPQGFVLHDFLLMLEEGTSQAIDGGCKKDALLLGAVLQPTSWTRPSSVAGGQWG
jgi:hypothetical protein